MTGASASGPNVTYYACLKSGKLTHVGTTAPTCAVGCGQKSRGIRRGRSGTNGTNGTNGRNFLTSSSTPTGACNTGDTDLALDSDELWTCLAGVWTDTGSNVKGARKPACLTVRQLPMRGSTSQVVFWNKTI